MKLFSGLILYMWMNGFSIHTPGISSKWRKLFPTCRAPRRLSGHGANTGGISSHVPICGISEPVPVGETGVRIALDVPDELVLLSDFETWHYPLNRWYLPRSEEDEKLFEKELAALGLSLLLPANLPDQLRKRMEKSWEIIFDLAFYWEELNRPWEEKSIQATLWEIRLEWVTKLEMFTGNGKVYKNRLG